MSIVKMQHLQPLLMYSGAANTPEFGFEPELGPESIPGVGIDFGFGINLPGFEGF